MRTSWTNERIVRDLATRNPQPDERLEGLEHSVEARRLLEQIVHARVTDQGAEVGSRSGGDPVASGRRLGFLSGPAWAALPRPRMLVAVVLAAVLAAVLAVAITLPLTATSGGGLGGPTVSALHASRPFVPANGTHTRAGRWRLLDAVLSGRWLQNTEGPPPGLLTCAGPRACYVMAGTFSSPSVNAPLLAESLYASSDLGASWTVVPMPKGFSPTSSLSCPAAGTCAVGGTLGGAPVLLVTTDGGSQWTTVPATGLSGDLVELACFSATACDGIAGPSWAAPEHPAGGLPGSPNATPSESFVTTPDGGRTWSAAPLRPSEVVGAFACSDATSCLVMGRQASTAVGSSAETDFVQITSDGGATWTAGSLPQGFTLGPSPALSCADAQHCMLSGMVPVTIANPPECHKLPTAMHAPSTPATPPPMSPAVAAISRTESQLWAQSAAEEASGGLVGCVGGTGGGTVSDIASTSDGGLSWIPDALPANVPQPSIGSIACASATQCWASGSEAVLQRVGKALDGGSPVMLGTTDGGASWSKVVFNVPAGAPNPYGQSYLSIGDIECPEATACVALGAAAQSSPMAPVYSFISAPTP